MILEESVSEGNAHESSVTPTPTSMCGIIVFLETGPWC